MTIIECGSEIERVVVYARGAVVTRRVALPATLPEEAVEICVPGLTALADAGSVRALCEGDREVTALDTRLVIPEVAVERGALAERVRALRLEQERLAAERQSLAELRAALAGTGLDPALSRWAKNLDPAARFADALALSGLVDGELARLDTRLHALGEALVKNRRDLAAAELAAAQGTPAETDGERRAALSVRIRFGAGAGKLSALAIEYVVAAARWWPAYTARFTAAATKVSLAIDAFVAQASGEDWRGVALALSTAHLAHDARLPELRSLRFGRAQPAPKRGYRAPPEGLDALFEGYDRAASQAAPPPRREKEKEGLALLDEILEETRAKASDEGHAVATRGAADAVFRIPPMQAQGAAVVAETPAAPASRAEPAAPLAKFYDEPPMPPFPPPPRSGGLLSRMLPAPSAAPMPARKKIDVKARLGRSSAPIDEDDGARYERMEDVAAAVGGGGEYMLMQVAVPAAIEPGDAWLDFDALVMADPGDRAHRGRLVRRPEGARAGGVDAESFAAPPLARDPLATRGRFDHRYDAEGTADVPASGRPHRVAVGVAETHAAPRFVAVPREAAEVYREVEIKNPFDAPLLAGPVDVFLDGALMTTSELAFVDRNGTLHIGLGIEERLRVARNARVEETHAGLLGGSLVVDHHVTVDVASSLGRKVTVEVLERIPVTDDKDIEIKLTHARPEGEKYTQADRGAPIRKGYRFTVEVPAGDKAKIEFGYRVTLPAKNEIVGGNRRE
jgi:hypothetical protein